MGQEASSDRIALVDMDGTLVDYDAGMIQSYDELIGPGEFHYTKALAEYGRDNFPDYLWARIELIKKQSGWWRNLPRLEVGFEIVQVLREFDLDIHIATKGPGSKPQAWAEKLEWARRELPFADVHVTEKKSLLYGKILVDDWPPYAEEWIRNRPRGLVVLPPHEYNTQYPDINQYYHDMSVRVMRYYPEESCRDALRFRLERMLDD